MAAALFRRSSRCLVLACTLALPVLVSGCVDAPSAPEGSGAAQPSLVIAPTLSLVAPNGDAPLSVAQASALGSAFDQIDRFRVVVRRVRDNSLVKDTVVGVTPGLAQHDLSVGVTAAQGEQFSVTLTGLKGATVLFVADAVIVTAAPVGAAGGGGPPPTPTNITLRYSGPGATATTLQVSPSGSILAPGGTRQLTATVQDQAGAPIAGVPIGWTSGAPGVVSVNASGLATAAAEGPAQIVVATPSGLETRAWIYVAAGELAYVEGGTLKVRPVAGGTAAERGGGASQPSWSADGSQLFYASGGTVVQVGGGSLVSGSWPSLSPDGTKLAFERGGQVFFSNADGTVPTAGPGGGAPIWRDGSTLVVAGGGLASVRADGADRQALAGGSTSGAAASSGGSIAYVGDGALRIVGRADPLLVGTSGRPSWSADGRWLVVNAAGGLNLVPADASGPGIPVPGLGGATDPAFRPAGALSAPPGVTVTGVVPDPPVPGGEATIQGGGFDWIIPANNRVSWPTLGGTEDARITAVGPTSLGVVVPPTAARGQVHVQTRSGSGLLAYEPAFGSVAVVAATSWERPVPGVVVRVLKASDIEVARGETDAAGKVFIPGIEPGSYALVITPPAGFQLAGEARRNVTLQAAAFPLPLELQPIAQTVTTIPENLKLEVGASVAVRIVARDLRGDTIRTVRTAQWVGGTPDVSASGEGLTGTIRGLFAGGSEGTSRLQVVLDGRVFSLPVTVTSFIGGTLTREVAAPAPVGAPAEGDSVPSAAAALEPAPGVPIVITRGESQVGRVTTDAQGRYKLAGLFRGTYGVAPDAVDGRVPVPENRSVALDAAHHTGTADFLMSAATIDHLILALANPTLEALGATGGVGVRAFDNLGGEIDSPDATFVSADPGIASVGPTGTVTAQANGTTWIRVTVAGVTDSIQVVVSQKATDLTLLDSESLSPLPELIRAPVSTSRLLKWRAEDANGHPIPPEFKVPTFTTADALRATVDASGDVQVVNVGDVVIGASMDGATDSFTIVGLGVSPGDVIIATAQDIVDAGFVGVVTGDLVIEDTGLTDLDGLEGIQEVQGSVFIRRNGALGSISGIGGIESVGGDVILEDNDALATPVGLSAKLASVEGSVRILDNGSITNADAFGYLESIGGDFEIADNPSLQNLNGVAMLEYVGGSLRLITNPSLNSAGNLPQLRVIEGALEIDAGAVVFGVPALVDARGGIIAGGSISPGSTTLQELHFPQLLCAGGIDIYGNQGLTALTTPSLNISKDGCGAAPLIEEAARRPFRTGLDRRQAEVDRAAAARAERFRRGPQEVGVRLARQRAARLTARERTAAAVDSRRSRLADVEPRRVESKILPRLGVNLGGQRSLAGQARWNAFLERRAAHRGDRREGAASRERAPRPPTARAETVQPVYGEDASITIYDNPLLDGLVFPALTTVEGSLYFWQNSGLTALGFPVLTVVEGDIDISANAALTSVALTVIPAAGALYLYENALLTTFTAPSLQQAGEVDVDSNPTLTGWSLPALSNVEGDVEIGGNDALTSISMPLLAHTGGDLAIAGNDALETVDIATDATLHVGVSLEFTQNPALTSVQIPGLGSTGESIYLGDNAVVGDVMLGGENPLSVGWALDVLDNDISGTLTIGGNPLTVVDEALFDHNDGDFTLEMPGFHAVGDDFELSDNAGLRTFTAGQLAGNGTIDDSYIADNELLESFTLAGIVNVDGQWDVLDNPLLESFSAPDVFHVGGLSVEGNGTGGTPTLFDFPALDNLAGSIQILENPGLTSFGLPVLTTLGDELFVEMNPHLAGFEANNLQSAVYVEFYDNAALASFSMTSLDGLRDGLDVISNAALTTFDLQALQRTMPEDIPGAPPLGTPAGAPSGLIGGLAYIYGNPALTDFDLSSLYRTESVVVEGNAALATLPGLGALHEGASVEVVGNASLTGLSGLAGVTRLFGVTVEGNAALSGLSGLSSLIEVSNLAVTDNGAMTAITGMTALTTVWRGLRIESNPLLASVAFPALVQVGPGGDPVLGAGDLTLADHATLSSLSLPLLAEVDGTLTIDANAALAGLVGMPALTSSVWAVTVTGNAILTDVGALGQIASVAGAFTVTGNPLLDLCHLNEVVYSILSHNDEVFSQAFGGGVDLSNNGSPCS